ncbi:MAG: glycoside hydrolase family 65 protein [Anaerolineales bacterium]|nr:glycoside hydrolase family 65 protein [Anaerolineales bacterium]
MWQLVEDMFEPERNLNQETLLALGNGYIGMRGTFEEGVGAGMRSVEGTYLNGFYESDPIRYGEKFQGYPDVGQTMLNVANAKVVRLYVDGELMGWENGRFLHHTRTFDMRRGVLRRELRWQSESGKEVAVESERLVLHAHKHLALMRYTVTPLNFSGNIVLYSGIDGQAKNLSSDDDPRLGAGMDEDVLQFREKVVGEETAVLHQQTKTTGFHVVCGVHNKVEGVAAHPLVDDEFRLGHRFAIEVAQGEPVTLVKTIAYATSQDVAEEELMAVVQEELAKGTAVGYDALNAEQADFLADFWYHTDVVIKGDDQLQLGLRFNMFHLLQSVGRDGHTNIAAKGLTGQGYEGHTFWDTEIYILPFFLYTNPAISRKLLEYRYHILDKARQRARQMAHPVGALFPWRTISGEECSAYYPAGTAQYHINADVAFAIKRYHDATQDAEFMQQFGAEILFETARLWLHVGHYVDGKFHIDAVTGPDEYTALVNNNAYTNLMAAENMRFAAHIADWLQQEYPHTYQTLAEKIALAPDEAAAWAQAAAQMFVPYDEARQLLAQDDSFLQKAVWDFANTPADHYPLLLHYHPLVLYRYQVCKQADAVLAEFLLHDHFDLAQKRRDYDYYEPLTTHDSSLSACIFGIMAAEVGYPEKAYRYFIETAIADLDNKKGNTKDGIHAANMAGAWLSIAFGFGGMRVGDGLIFNPIIPAHWESYSFRVQYRGRLIEVTVTQEAATYKLLDGDPLEVQIGGEGQWVL